MRRYESYSTPISRRNRSCSTSRVSPGDQEFLAIGNESMSLIIAPSTLSWQIALRSITVGPFARCRAGGRRTRTVGIAVAIHQPVEPPAQVVGLGAVLSVSNLVAK